MELVVVKTFLSLAAVILVMLAVVVVMKKFSFGPHGGSSQIIDMKVIGTMRLQPKQTVAVLKIMNKLIIIGASEEGMRTLAEISDEESLRQIEEKLASLPTEKRWFGTRTQANTRMSFADALSFQIGKLSVNSSMLFKRARGT